MQLSPMQTCDVTAVAGLEKECFSVPWSEKSLMSELDNPLSVWLVAREGETLAGYIGAQAVLDEADMMNLAVAPQYRQCGIGTALVRALVDTLRERGVRTLTLEVRASNETAIRVYAALGFAQVGRRRNYYEKPKEDALILRKEWQV